MLKLIKFVVMFTSFFGAQSLGYLLVCLMRGDAFFQLFGTWHSTEVLMWASALLLLIPVLSGVSHLMTREQRATARSYSSDVLLKRWIGLQMDGLLPKEVVAAQRIHSRRL